MDGAAGDHDCGADGGRGDDGDAHPVLEDAFDGGEGSEVEGVADESGGAAGGGGEGVDGGADHERLGGLGKVLEDEAEAAEGEAPAVTPEVLAKGGDGFPHWFTSGGHIRRKPAMVFIHSSRKILRPSRLRHQPSREKKSLGAAMVRISGPPPISRSARRKRRRARPL